MKLLWVHSLKLRLKWNCLTRAKVASTTPGRSQAREPGARHLGTSTPHFFWAPQSFALWYCFKRCRLIGKAMIWYLVQAATILYHAAFMNGKREERKIDDRARRCNCTAGERAVRWLIGSRGGGGIPKPPSHSLGTLNLTKSRCDKGITSSYR
jgi:hypothetical protein